MGTLREHIRTVCWITKTTDRCSKCLILITFPRQQRLSERASLLRYMYIASLVLRIFIFQLCGTNIFCAKGQMLDI